MTHTFHIPVMGTGFTIDTPLKVAKYGISSVISIVDDNLIERMRRFYAEKYGESYEEITSGPDRRARRITAYLNLVRKTVATQVETLKASPFEPGSEISAYFELMSDRTMVKQQYLQMLRCPHQSQEKASIQRWLREQVVAGSIDVNIMTKADRPNASEGMTLPKEYSDAMAALRGYAESDLESSVVFSAGLNLQLYGYISTFDDFYPDENGSIKKKVILKVSDFRSACVQARNLAKKGVWVSEYRVESGLNCGGHAFPTAGLLMGPILRDFRDHREEFRQELFGIYRNALFEKKGRTVAEPRRSVFRRREGSGRRPNIIFCSTTTGSIPSDGARRFSSSPRRRPSTPRRLRSSSARA